MGCSTCRMLIMGAGLLRARIGRDNVCDDMPPICAGRLSYALKLSRAVFRRDYLSDFLSSGTTRLIAVLICVGVTSGSTSLTMNSTKRPALDCGSPLYRVLS